MTPVNEQYYFIRSITLTPMRVILKPLNREIGNRALRLRGAENYMRVYIRDENDEILDTLEANIRSRFKLKMFKDGIKCMNRIYYCIGFSTSQQKDCSYWFTSLNDRETSEQVRAQFGDFTTVKNLAIYVARIGQYFTSSRSTGIKLKHIDTSAVVINIPDSAQSESISSLKRLWSRVQSLFKNTVTSRSKIV